MRKRRYSIPGHLHRLSCGVIVATTPIRHNQINASWLDNNGLIGLFVRVFLEIFTPTHLEHYREMEIYNLVYTTTTYNATKIELVWGRSHYHRYEKNSTHVEVAYKITFKWLYSTCNLRIMSFISFKCNITYV